MIRTDSFGLNKPEPINSDSRGCNIETGFRVAYNRSGDVVIGTIMNYSSEWVFSERQKYWRLNFKMVIQHESGNISTISNPNSFVII